MHLLKLPFKYKRKLLVESAIINIKYKFIITLCDVTFIGKIKGVYINQTFLISYLWCFMNYLSSALLIMPELSVSAILENCLKVYFPWSSFFKNPINS